MLDDIDRIEVIRGPGAAIWGANAVNGVINIVTKAAAETQGTLVRVDGGRAGAQGAVRYGGTFGAASYRVYSQWTGRDQSLIAPDTRANDASHSVTTGFRADWTTTPGAFIVEGDFTAGQTRALWPNFNPQTAAREPIATIPSDTQGGHLLGRWTQTPRQRRGPPDPVLRRRGEPAGADGRYHAAGRSTSIRNTTGRSGPATTWWPAPATGSSARRLRDAAGFSLTPADNASSLLTTFVQDEIALFADRLAVTVGTQVPVRLRLGRGRAADRARDVEDASPPARLGGRLPRPADAVAI